MKFKLLTTPLFLRGLTMNISAYQYHLSIKTHVETVVKIVKK